MLVFGFASAQVARMFVSASVRSCPFISADSMIEVASWLHNPISGSGDAVTVFDALHTEGFAFRLRAIAACLPEQSNDALVYQMLGIVSDERISFEVLRSVLFPSGGTDRVRSLRSAIRLIWDGGSVSSAAAVTGIDRSALSDSVAWLGTMQARDDVMLDRAISIVAEGCTAVELADMLHTSESSARRLLLKARGVIAELN